MSAVADKLREARALIERGWTQGHSARTADGRVTIETDPQAAQWCTVGALSRVHNAHWSPDYFAAFSSLRRAAGSTDIVHWNDAPKRTKAEVLAAFDKAIELASQESAK